MNTSSCNQSEASCGCGSEGAAIPRRDILKLGTLGAAGFALGRVPIMAGPFRSEGVAGHLNPTDKKLSSEWLASLVERGEAEALSAEELAYVGMPVGGIGCGQLYLGGDGRLWHWDIFKSNYRREEHDMKLSAMTMGGHYTAPVAVGEEYNY